MTRPNCSTKRSTVACRLHRHALAPLRGRVACPRWPEAQGVTREALYKAFSDKGDPRLSTLLGVLKTLDLKLSARPAKASSGPQKGST